MTAVSNIPLGVTLTFTGNAAMQQYMGGDLGSNMIILLVAAIVLMMLVCKFLFNHVLFQLLSIVSVFTGLILTFVMIGIVGLPFSMTTIGAMPILLGIGVDFYATKIFSSFFLSCCLFLFFSFISNNVFQFFMICPSDLFHNASFGVLIFPFSSSRH